VLVALSVATACCAQSPPPGAGERGAMDSSERHATHAVHEAMSAPGALLLAGAVGRDPRREARVRSQVVDCDGGGVRRGGRAVQWRP